MAYFSGFIATPTKIRNFLECPKKYFFYHVNPQTKRLFPEKSYFTLGHHVHNTLRDFFVQEANARTEEMLMGLFETAWQSQVGIAGGFKTPQEETEFKERGVAMLKRFLETENWTVTPRYLPEKEGEFPGYQQATVDSELAFGGIVDRIDEEPDGSLHIIDYKTGRNDDPDEWQLPMYAVLVSRMYGRAVGKTSYIMLEHGKRHTTEVTIEGNLEVIRKVKEVITKIPKSKLLSDFTCHLGESCRHCNYLVELGFDPKTGEKIKEVKEEKAQEQLFSADLPF